MREPSRSGWREGVTAEQAAALPMAAETAWRALDDLGVQPGELLIVHGAGTTVGEAAVRFALHRGIRVIATAGPTRAAVLEGIGAQTLIELTGDPDRVLTVSDFAAAAELGARITTEIRYDLMGEFARLAGEGVLAVSVARTYTLDQIQEAAKLSQSRRPGGKVMLVL
ncbi:zinc-binding dehydrogenase [Streptomyces sp. NPDC091212]|uniref:zinc-binding dehydrogenase n=1 Tax=Streptomyces sp. NPDC091212 TaxID=3155191 RepID=UPI00343E8FC9